MNKKNRMIFWLLFRFFVYSFSPIIFVELGKIMVYRFPPLSHLNANEYAITYKTAGSII